MQYRKDKRGREISLLGYGCMRFTKKGGSIDLDKAQKELDTAIRGGVNYLDTLNRSSPKYAGLKR